MTSPEVKQISQEDWEVVTVASSISQESYSPDEEKDDQSSDWGDFLDDFNPEKGGDFKILRAIGRTALVNAVVTTTALTGGATAGVGYLAGGAITAKRFGDGVEQDDPKEVVKSLAVFGSATSASMIGQAVTGAILVGVVGASLPLAAPLAFGVGCCSGITAGALSEWGVDRAWHEEEKEDVDEFDHWINQEIYPPSQGDLLYQTVKKNRRKTDFRALFLPKRDGEETLENKALSNEQYRKFRENLVRQSTFIELTVINSKRMNRFLNISACDTLGGDLNQEFLDYRTELLAEEELAS